MDSEKDPDLLYSPIISSPIHTTLSTHQGLKNYTQSNKVLTSSSANPMSPSQSKQYQDIKTNIPLSLIVNKEMTKG